MQRVAGDGWRKGCAAELAVDKPERVFLKVQLDIAVLQQGTTMNVWCLPKRLDHFPERLAKTKSAMVT